MARETARAVHQRALAQLRQEIANAKRRRAAALAHARELCRRSKAATREAVRRYRKQERERMNATIAAWRAETKQRCRARRERIRRAAKTEIQRRKALADEKRFRRAQERQLERRVAKERAASDRRIERRRREEDDDQVLANIDPGLHSVFHAVKRSIKPSPRKSRTEAFLEYVHENPEEVLAIQSQQADSDVARMIRERQLEELEELETRLRAAGPNGDSALSSADTVRLRELGIDPHMKPARARARKGLSAEAHWLDLVEQARAAGWRVQHAERPAWIEPSDGSLRISRKNRTLSVGPAGTSREQSRLRRGNRVVPLLGSTLLDLELAAREQFTGAPF